MPSILIEVRKKYPKNKSAKLMEGVHGALKAAFKLLPSDCNVRLVEHKTSHFLCSPNLANPEKFTQITVDAFSGRSLEAKKLFYRLTVSALELLGIPKDHVKILIRESGKENWGIRGGQAASEIDLGYKTDV